MKYFCKLMTAFVLIIALGLSLNSMIVESSSKYVKINIDETPIFINEGGQLIERANLKKGQIYKIISDYGSNWYKVSFGGNIGFVYKGATETSNKRPKKEITSTSLEGKATIIRDSVVYDNSQSSLIPIGTIKSNQKIDIVKDYGNWYRISFLNREGYIHKSNVNLLFNKDNKYFEVITDSVSIKVRQNGKLVDVGTLQKGQTYKRISDYGPNWHKISFAGKEAYIFSPTTVPSRKSYRNDEYNTKPIGTVQILNTTNVYDNTNGKLISFAKINQGTTYPVVKDYGNWWGINLSGRLGYIYKSHTALKLESNQHYFKVLVDNTPIFDNRSGKLEVVGYLRKGQIYKRVSDYGPNWHKIKFGNQYGYIYSKSTTAVNNTNWNHNYKTYKNIHTVTNVQVVDNSNGKLTPIGTIKSGQIYPVVSNYGNWYRVIFADRVGYIHKSGVRDLFNSNTKAFRMRVNAPIFKNIDGKLVQIGKLNKGQIFARSRDYGNWHELEWMNDKVYVWKDSTEPSILSYDNVEYSKSLRTIKLTNLYTNTTANQPVMSLSSNIELPILKKVDQHWYMTNILGRTLYVKSQDLLEGNLRMKDNHQYIDVLRHYLIDGPLISDNKFTKDINETVEAANLILAGKINFPSYGIIDITNGIDWTSGGDIVRSEQLNSYLRQLHGLFFINDLTEAYLETGDKRYILKGFEIIKEWETNNPYSNPMHRMAWHDEGTARRLANLVNFFDAAKNILTYEQMEYLFFIMTKHAELLTVDSFYSSGTNHGMFQDKALIIFSKYFYYYDSYNDYYKLAVSRLESYFNQLISDDYVHLEHSPSYHQVIANSLRNFANALKEFDELGTDERFINIYEQMAEYATFVIKPDGTWPLIADTFVTNYPSRTLWQDNLYYQYALSQGKEGEKPLEVDKVFMDAGYAIFRNEWSIGPFGTYLFFTAAYHTHYHKHSDDLSLWLYHNRDLIVESGPYGYNLSDDTTQFAYSSFAHNTLIVNDKGLPRVDGKYDSTYLVEANIDDENISYVKGINKRYDNVTHERSLTYNRLNNQVSIIDNINSNQVNNYKLLWHIAPGITPTINDETMSVELRDEQGVLLADINIKGDNNIKIHSYFGEAHPIYKGRYFDSKLGINNIEIVPIYVIVIETDTTKANITTEINLK